MAKKINGVHAYSLKGWHGVKQEFNDLWKAVDLVSKIRKIFCFKRVAILIVDHAISLICRYVTPN